MGMAINNFQTNEIIRGFFDFNRFSQNETINNEAAKQSVKSIQRPSCTIIQRNKFLSFGWIWDGIRWVGLLAVDLIKIKRTQTHTAPANSNKWMNLYDETKDVCLCSVTLSSPIALDCAEWCGVVFFPFISTGGAACCPLKYIIQIGLACYIFDYSQAIIKWK